LLATARQATLTFLSSTAKTRSLQSVDPSPSDAQARSFGVLELSVPTVIADVETIPPAAVMMTDQVTA